MQWRLLKIKDKYNYFRHIKCVFLYIQEVLRGERETKKDRER